MKSIKITFLTVALMSMIALPALADVDFSIYQSFLNKYLKTQVNGERLFDYKALHSNDDDVFALADQADIVAATDPNGFSSNEEKLAFWLNAYNFTIVRIVVDNYRDGLKSIKDIATDPFKLGLVFAKKYYRIAGKKRSFKTIEDDIIRPLALQMYKPSKNQRYAARIHFALNCASMGCPPLSPHIFEANTLEQHLDDVTKYALNLKRHLTTKSGRVIISKIFDWYDDDFEHDTGSLRSWLLVWAPESIKPAIRALRRDRDLDYRDYDWNLNKVK